MNFYLFDHYIPFHQGLHGVEHLPPSSNDDVSTVIGEEEDDIDDPKPLSIEVTEELGEKSPETVDDTSLSLISLVWRITEQNPSEVRSPLFLSRSWDTSSLLKAQL